MEYVEVRGKSVDIAVQAAIEELGVKSTEEVDVEILQEPERGFLGIGGRDAVVKVTRKPPNKSRKRRKRKSSGDKEGSESRDNGKAGRSSGGRDRSQQDNRGGGKRDGASRGSSRGQGNRNGAQNGGNQGTASDRQPGDDRTGSGNDRKSGSGRSGGRANTRGDDRPRGQDRKQSRGDADRKREEINVPIEEQVPVVESFLTGLVGAFGLDGAVDVTIDGDVIVADIRGEQTESMVGNRGSVIEAVHELTKTVMHRKMQTASRLRLDIAGYGERRRRALGIYAGQLVEQITAEGGEIMLEPMSASDRKVIHDAVAESEGVRSYSEGEAPQRYVVLQRVPSQNEPGQEDPDQDKPEHGDAEAAANDESPVDESPGDGGPGDEGSSTVVDEAADVGDAGQGEQEEE